MKNADFVSGAVLAAFGLLLLFVIIPWQIADPSSAMISPRLMPQICAIGITGLALALCIQAWAAERTRAGAPFERAELLALGGVVALFVVGLFLLRAAGPLIPAILIILVPMLAMGERRIPVLLGVPAVCIGFVYVILYGLAGSSIS